MISAQTWFRHRTGMSLVVLTLFGNLFFLPPAVAVEASAAPGASPGDANKAQVASAYGKLPLSFIQNDGQVEKKVKFYEKGSGHATYFTKDGVSLSLVGSSGKTPNPACSQDSPFPPFEKGGKGGFDACAGETKAPGNSPQSALVKLIPLGANKNPKIVAKGVQEGKVNYFIGNDPKQWKTNVPTYQAVVYQEIYSGIDMKFYGNNRQLEYDIVVKPGVDPSKVKLAYEGIEGLHVTEDGDLEIGLKGGAILQKKPVVYQEIDGKRVYVAGTFKIRPRTNRHTKRSVYGFEVESYDRAHPLLIDPTLVYSTYLGGSGDDRGWGLRWIARATHTSQGILSRLTFPLRRHCMGETRALALTPLSPS